MSTLKNKNKFDLYLKLLLFIIITSCITINKWSGRYNCSVNGVFYELILNKDSSFLFRKEIHPFVYTLTGNWVIKIDTLILIESREIEQQYYFIESKNDTLSNSIIEFHFNQNILPEFLIIDKDSIKCMSNSLLIDVKNKPSDFKLIIKGKQYYYNIKESESNKFDVYFIPLRNNMWKLKNGNVHLSIGKKTIYFIDSLENTIPLKKTKNN